MPDWKPHIRSRLASLRLSPLRENEIIDELSEHLEERWRELVASGTPEDEATKLALAGFREGNLLAHHLAPLRQAHAPLAVTPGAPAGRLLGDLGRDLRYAARTLFRTPVVTAIAIVSLGLGIGATAGIFSVFHQVLVQPLAVPDPSQLVNLSAPGPKPGFGNCGQAGDCEVVFSYPMFRDLQRTQTVFTDIAAHVDFGANLAYEAQTSSSKGLLVSGSYFPVLELHPALGRLLNSNDDKLVGESRVVVLGYSYWSSRFGRDPAVLNTQLIVNGQSLTIVGVAPRGFEGTTIGIRPAVFVPITLREALDANFNTWSSRTDYWAYLVARLRPGTTLEAARASLGTQYHAIINDVEAPLQTDMSAQTMARFRAKPILLAPGGRGQSSVPDEARTPLRLLLGVTAFVLLIACANIANLLLARSAARAGEMAIRLSIGASRPRLIGQLLTESLLLAVFGGSVGLVVAHWTLVLVVSLLPPEVQHTITFSISRVVILFGIGVTFATGLLFGLFPALYSTRPDLVSTLKNQAGQPAGAKDAARVRLVLATSQIALSMLLLSSSGFFLKSLLNISRLDLGFKIDHVVTFGLSPDLNGYSVDRTRLFYQRLEDELRAAPGVAAVTMSNVPLLAGTNRSRGVAVQGFKAGPDTDSGSRYNRVGPGYFSALRIPLIAGREFTDADTVNSRKVALVNQTFARKFGLGNDAVGKLMGWAPGEDYRSKLDTTIVGVVEDAKYSEVKQAVPPQFFVPYRQDAGLGALQVYVRASDDVAQAASAITAVVKRLDPNLPIEDLETLPDQVRNNTFLDRMITTLSAAFALLATLLAANGLYGVLAYTVAQRTREIGLRMALGAAPDRVRAMVLRQVAIMTLVGALAGLVGALAVGKAAQSMLFQMTGADPTVLALSAVALALVALGAGFIPAHRASRVDPMRALKYE
jgi:predicted permease